MAFKKVDNESPGFADITGDGKPEIICHTDGVLGYVEVNWAEPRGPWRFQPISKKGGWGMYTHGLGTGDVNGDGRIDYLLRQGHRAANVLVLPVAQLESMVALSQARPLTPRFAPAIGLPGDAEDAVARLLRWVDKQGKEGHVKHNRLGIRHLQNEAATKQFAARSRQLQPVVDAGHEGLAAYGERPALAVLAEAGLGHVHDFGTAFGVLQLRDVDVVGHHRGAGHDDRVGAVAELQQQRLLDVLDRVVDDGVEPELDLVPLGGLGCLALGPARRLCAGPAL